MSITAYQVEAVGHDRTGRDFGYVNIMYRYGDLIHAEEDVVPDHILKPVGQQAGEVNGYVLSGLSPDFGRRAGMSMVIQSFDHLHDNRVLCY